MSKTSKVFLFVSIILFAVLAISVSYFLCDRGFFPSKEEKYFYSKLESFKNSGEKYINLENLNNFDWDRVCFFEELSTINLKQEALIKEISFKPKFLFKSKYNIDSDVIGALFVDTETKKYKIFRYFMNDIESINLQNKHSKEKVFVNSYDANSFVCYKNNDIIVSQF